jgi:hypothetical protein
VINERATGIGARLLEDRCSALGVGRNFVGQHFDRDRALQPRVVGLADDTHAATAKLGLDAIVGERPGTHDEIGCYSTARGPKSAVRRYWSNGVGPVPVKPAMTIPFRSLFVALAAAGR